MKANMTKLTNKHIMDKGIGILTWEQYTRKNIEELDFDVFDDRFSVELYSVL